MKNFTNEEKVLKYIIDKNKNKPTNKEFINKKDLNSLGLTENEVIKSLLILATDNHIVIKQKSVHNNLSIPWSLELSSSGIHYFENLEIKKKENRRLTISSYSTVIAGWITILATIILAII